MKKFLVKISCLIIIIIIADFSIGYVLGKVVQSISVGGQGRNNYIANEAAEDILVFGSSRAVHHYNTPMMEDSLALSSYNCGDDGMGIIHNYARLLMILERHTPRVIVYDINDDFDLLKNDNHKYLGPLKPYYYKKCIPPIFIDVDKTEKYKMMSHLYRYNSIFLQNIFVYLTGISHDGGIKGYRAKIGELDKMKITTVSTTNQNNEYDSLKHDYINRFIDASCNAQLIFVISPIWYGSDGAQYKPIKDICVERGLPFLDYSNNPRFVHNDDYFIDGMHLNSKGADEFTKDLIKELRKLINN